MNKVEFASPAIKRTRAPGRPPKSSSLGADKRAAILDAGELLFADHGFYGVSVRDVAKHAGVDVALLYYYFATKRDLFDAVFERRAAILNQARMESIDAYEAATPVEQLTVEGTLDAFLRPTLNQAATDDPGWRAYFALVAQVNNTPIWGGQTMARYFDPVIQRLIALLRKVMPDVDEADVYWCYNFLSGSLTLAFSVTGRIDILSNGVCRSSDFTSIQDRLAKYAAAGFMEVCNRRRRSSIAP